MNQYKLRVKLNSILFDSGYLCDPEKVEDYIIACGMEFAKQTEDKRKTVNAIDELLKYGMIATRNGGKIKGGYINALQSGEIIITPYGRANLDMNRRDVHFARFVEEVKRSIR
jgi:hypothetical protein